MAPIGIFDSGFGGLTVFKSIRDLLPRYDYIYLGDNGRAPYGNRSFETVHQYSWQCVQWLFAHDCPLVILACNTASAKALRTIQQRDLPQFAPSNRVLGVIRPTAEVIGRYSTTKTIGVLGTEGTVRSGSYPLEINHFFPEVRVHQQACPIWVPLVEYGEYNQPGADYFVRKYLDELLNRAPDIDTLLLGCTHYPLLWDKITAHLAGSVQVVAQGDIVADSLSNYLHRHPEMHERLSYGGSMQFFTTDSTAVFDRHGAAFFGVPVEAEFVHLS